MSDSTVADIADASTPAAVVVVHGGAGATSHEAPAMADFCREVVGRVMSETLTTGGTALDAVVDAVRMLEDHPDFNAGNGAELTEDGTIELDASVMDGRRLRAGAVAALPPFRNPVVIARAVLDDGRHVLYTGPGAMKFAVRAGFDPVEAASLITPKALFRLRRAIARQGQPSLSTVGAVALDVHGHVAAATSTGGTAAQHHGRIGDSPIIGAGTYADDTGGACSATGSGEAIMLACVAHDVVTHLRDGRSADETADTTIVRFGERFDGRGGLICLDKHGVVGIVNNTTAMPWGLARHHDDPTSGW